MSERLQPRAFEKRVAETLKCSYLLYLPHDYDQTREQKWPLLLFLHGAGERGDDLNLVKKNGIPKLIEQGRDFPLIVVSPQCPAERWWPSETRTLSALLDELQQRYAVDPDRVYLTGLSMGGFGTWALAAEEPGRFAAIAPICGGGDPIWCRRLTSLPIWAFHGAKDPTVPLRRSEDMVEAVRRSGGNPRFTVYPDAGHDSWTETYNNPEFYDWLLAQRRGQRSPAP